MIIVRITLLDRDVKFFSINTKGNEWRKIKILSKLVNCSMSAQTASSLSYSLVL